MLGVAKLMLQLIGAYVVILVTLDEIWWTRRRYWRYLGTAILTLIFVGLLQWPTP